MMARCRKKHKGKEKFVRTRGKRTLRVHRADRTYISPMENANVTVSVIVVGRYRPNLSASQTCMTGLGNGACNCTACTFIPLMAL